MIFPEAAETLAADAVIFHAGRHHGDVDFLNDATTIRLTAASMKTAMQEWKRDSQQPDTINS